ncbi:unnamed protein product [Rhizophagus irregularis]|nr:unnamed protein product [Rhizophagus irregularis]
MKCVEDTYTWIKRFLEDPHPKELQISSFFFSSENHSDADREDKPDRSWTQLSRAQHIELENQLSSSVIYQKSRWR